MKSVSKERIAILHYAAPPIVGGVESTIYHHARLLVNHGYAVSVIAGRGSDFHPQVALHCLPEIDSRHAQVLEIGKALSSGHVPPQFMSLRDQLARQLRAILKDMDVCIVHNVITLHKNFPLTAALRLLVAEGLFEMIAWCHDFAWQDKLYTADLHPGYPWNLLRIAWPGIRYVVVSNDRRNQLAELLGLPEESIAVVTPGVDVERFLKLDGLTSSLIDKLDLLDADPFVLLPARVTRRKNIQFAIRITAELQKFFPLTALVITGPPGPHNPKNLAYLDALKSLCNELKVADRVHFLYEQGEHGKPLHLPDKVVADLYQLADLLLFPSRREGFGIPVLEAGLARVPVFAADIPSVRESAGNFAEFFDPDGHPGSVAESIASRLAQDPAYRLRKRVLSHFTWQAIVKHGLIPMIEEAAKHDHASK